jgi:hypothetical protein
MFRNICSYYVQKIGAMRFQVARRSEHILVNGHVIEVGPGRARRAGESTEMDGLGCDIPRRQSVSLDAPTFLVEPAVGSHHNRTHAYAIVVGANPVIFCPERDALLGRSYCCYRERKDAVCGAHMRPLYQRRSDSLQNAVAQLLKKNTVCSVASVSFKLSNCGQQKTGSFSRLPSAR